MDINFVVKQGDVLPHVETFYIRNQEYPCPPEIISILISKIHTELSKNPTIQNFDFPFKSCPVHVTLERA